MTLNVHDAIAFAKAFEKKVKGVDSELDIILNPSLADHLMDWGVNAAKAGYLSPKATKAFLRADKFEILGVAGAATGGLMMLIEPSILAKKIGGAVTVGGLVSWGGAQIIGALSVWLSMKADLNNETAGADKFFWGDDKSETGLEKDYV